MEKKEGSILDLLSGKEAFRVSIEIDLFSISVLFIGVLIAGIIIKKS